MSNFDLPWLTAAILIPLLGSLGVARVPDSDRARRFSVVLAALTLAATLGGWLNFVALDVDQACDPWDIVTGVLGAPIVTMDRLCAPLLPLVALIHFLVIVATPRVKVQRFSFSRGLMGEAILLATFSCRETLPLIALLACGTVPVLLELRARGRSTRVFAFHMGLFVGLVSLGRFFINPEAAAGGQTMWALVPLMAAVMIRGGIVPAHCWVTELFEHATFGTALLFVTPMTGVYVAARMLVPVASHEVLNMLAWLSLGTAVYAAGLSLVQREARRFFSYQFLSYSALILVGLESLSPLGLTGSLCVWLSAGLAMTGFGLSLRSIEARAGRLSLADFHGLYDHAPTLALFFLLTGLAAVGFPGTFGFVGTDLLVEGTVNSYPVLSVAVFLTMAINGIAVLQAYFRIFTGKRHTSSVSLRKRPRERLAILTLAAIIFAGGIFPQSVVESRYKAALAILKERREVGAPGETADRHPSERDERSVARQ